MKINWKCPKCDNVRGIEEVQINVATSHVLIEVHEDGDAEFGEVSWDGGEVDRFQCMNCGWTIEAEHCPPFKHNVTEYQELFKWLKKEGMLADG